VTLSKVRRERMGHIELAAPVVHIWYLRGTRSWLAYLLMGTEAREELKAKQLEKVIYFAANLVTFVDDEKRHAFTTSWGVSTRMMGALVMTHAAFDAARGRKRDAFGQFSARAGMAGRFFHFEHKAAAFAVGQLDGCARHCLALEMRKPLDEVSCDYVHVIHDV